MPKVPKIVVSLRSVFYKSAALLGSKESKKSALELNRLSCISILIKFDRIPQL